MRNLKFIATAAVTFIIISCADLDLSPLSEGSSNNWYHDDTEYLMSLNDLMRAEFYPIDSYPWDDDVFSRNSQEETKNGNMTSESGTAKSRWLILYKAIARSLRILNNLQTAETTTDITPANIRQYKGEAYFHLGFSYAMLATYYGDVILDKKGMSLAEAYTASRSPKREVLDYAYECLDSAAELLSDSYTGQLRPTTGAALGFKVRFALFHEDYQKAIDAAEKLMDAGTYSLEPNYQELFQKPYSNELIFYFQGNKDLRYYCADLYGSVNNYCLRQIGGNCNRGPSIQLVCSYLCTDGLPIDESLLYDPKNFWANRDPRLTYTVQPFMLKNDPRYSDYIWTRQHEKTYLELIAKGQTNYTDSLLENKYPEYFIYGYEYVPGPYDTNLLYAFMIAMIYPYLPGSKSGVFQGISVFVGLIVSLGSSTVIGNIIAGLVITYMRPFKLGDRIKLNDTTGNVIEKTPLVTRIRTPKNEVVTIPNSFIMSSHTVNFSQSARDYGLIIHSEVSVGYDIPWRKTHQLLVEAALNTPGVVDDPRPFVLETSLQDYYPVYQVNAYIKDANQLAQVYSDLHQNIQDRFNEEGIEIMSPHYIATRDGSETTIPKDDLRGKKSFSN